MGAPKTPGFEGKRGMRCLLEQVSPDAIPGTLVKKGTTTDPAKAHYGSLFLRSLPSDDLRQIEPDLMIRMFNANERIHNEGDIINNILFPHNMTVSLISLMANGDAVESVCVGREGFVGVECMLGSAAATFGAVARRGQASSIALDRLLIRMGQLPSLRAALLHYARCYLAGISRLVVCNAVHTTRQRVCRRLLLEIDQTGQGDVAITQEGLARALGVRRTSANQICRELRAEGMIDYRRRHIRIGDAERTKEAACECYTYLRRVLCGLNA
jgi:CRP-like cAMP-binding protein